MNTATIFLIISLAGIIIMFVTKLIEAKTGKKSILSKISDNTNHVIHNQIAKIKITFSFVNKRNAILLGRFIIYHVLLACHKLYMKLKQVIKKHLENKPSSPINMVLGKGVIKRKGSVSFFLKHIVEESKRSNNTL
ncbi:MAG: hypothetical protein NUV47_04000 [Patescibacteria group bacterium]|nr:hypothetical protein [Patescibacteria group bacterium]